MMKVNKKVKCFALSLISVLTLVGCSGSVPNFDYDNVKLDAPTNLKYRSGILSWDDVKGANSYYINIDDNTERYSDISMLTLNHERTDFSVYVTAYSKEFNSSDNSEILNVKYLTEPTNLKRENGILTWDKVINASSYELVDLITKVKYNCKTNSFSSFNTSGDHKVKVRALGNDIDFVESLFSNEYTFKSLKSPANLAFNKKNSTITWDQVEGATGYVLSIDDEEFKLSGLSSTTYNFTLKDTLKHIVKVKALGDKNEYPDGGYSLPIQIKKCDPIDVSKIELSNTRSECINFKLPKIEGCVKYKRVVNNKDITMFNTDSVGLKIPAGITNISYQALAYEVGQIDKTNDIVTFYQDSDITYQTLNRMGSANNFKFNSQTQLVWDKVNEATHYIAQLDEEKETKLLTNSFYIDPKLTPGAHVFSVCSESSEPNSISSIKKSIAFKKLDVSSVFNDLTVKGDVLRWGKNNEASSYNLFLNGASRIVEGNYFSLKEFDSKTFSVKIAANGDLNNNILDSDMSNEISFTQLDSPKNLRVDASGNLTWTVIKGLKYKLIVNDKEIEHDNSGLINIKDHIKENENVIELSAYNDETIHVESNPAIIKDIKKLKDVTSAKISDNKITWNSVLNASEYLINFNGQDFVCKNNYFEPDLTTIKNKNVIKICAHNELDNNKFIDSNEYVFEFTSTKLNTPKNMSVETIFNDKESYKIIWDKVPNASYKLVVNNLIYETSDNFIIVPMEKSGLYNVSITSITTSINYYDSDPATFNLKRLNTPILNAFKEDEGVYTISWNAIENATSYTIYKYVYPINSYAYDTDLSNVLNIKADQTSISLLADLRQYRYEISIVAKDDNDIYQMSAVSLILNIEKGGK